MNRRGFLTGAIAAPLAGVEAVKPAQPVITRYVPMHIDARGALSVAEMREAIERSTRDMLEQLRLRGKV